MNDAAVVILLDTDDRVRPERADIEWLAARRRVERGAIQPHARGVAARFGAYDRRVELTALGIVVIQALSHQRGPRTFAYHPDARVPDRRRRPRRIPSPAADSCRICRMDGPRATGCNSCASTRNRDRARALCG